MFRYLFSVACLSVVVALAPCQAFATPTYYTVDLGTFDGGGSSTAYGAMYDGGNFINVVGSSSSSSSSTQQAFLYSYNIGSGSGGLTNISPSSSNPSVALGISTGGQITGFLGNSATSNAFDSSSSTLLYGTLGSTLGAVNANAQGFGVNSSGQVVGQLASGNTTHAFTAANSGGNWAITDIGQGGTSYAQAINNSGSIVGQDTWTNALQATVWSNTLQEINLSLALSAGTSYSIAKGINNEDQIVGYYIGSDGLYHAVWWKKGTNGDWVANDIPIAAGAQSYAFSINDDGLIVGEYILNSVSHAYIYDTVGNGFYDLLDLVADDDTKFTSLLSAAYITSENIPSLDNAIVGVGVTESGALHAFLAYDPIPAATPEPSSLCLLLVGAAGLVLRRRHMKRAAL